MGLASGGPRGVIGRWRIHVRIPLHGNKKIGANAEQSPLLDVAIATALRDMGYRGTVGLEAWASGDDVLALERFRSAFTLPLP